MEINWYNKEEENYFFPALFRRKRITSITIPNKIIDPEKIAMNPKNACNVSSVVAKYNTNEIRKIIPEVINSLAVFSFFLSNTFLEVIFGIFLDFFFTLFFLAIVFL